LSVDHIAALCARSPGLEAWILPDRATSDTADLLYFNGRTLPGDD
jgi:hypothetical protein